MSLKYKPASEPLQVLDESTSVDLLEDDIVRRKWF